MDGVIMAEVVVEIDPGREAQWLGEDVM